MKEPTIKVGILVDQNEISFKLHGDFLLNNKIKLSNKSLKAQANGRSIILKDRNSILFQEDSLLFKPIKQKETKFEVENVTIGIDFHWEQKENEIFEGNILIINRNKKLTLINEINVEKYLQSVISSEMNSDSPYEYLKAHSIISRSWLLAQLVKSKNQTNVNTPIIDESERIIWYDKSKHTDFDVCADDHCQRYQGITRIQKNNVSKAIEETSGLVLVYNDEICDARFSKCCGGILEEYENVWDDTHYPYLVALFDGENKDSFLYPKTEEEFINFIKSNPKAYCNTDNTKLLQTVLNEYDQTTKDFYRWKVEIKQLALKTLLQIKLGIDFGEIKQLIPIERGKSGRIKKLKIIGTKKELTIGKELEIRRILSEKHLYSSAFFVEYVYKDNPEIPCKFILHGAGWGHGVGFCQIGGAVMASKGKKYDEILFHYFPNTLLKKLY